MPLVAKHYLNVANCNVRKQLFHEVKFTLYTFSEKIFVSHFSKPKKSGHKFKTHKATIQSSSLES